MPDLKCTVQTCVHNYKFLCDLDKIQVGGLVYTLIACAV